MRTVGVEEELLLVDARSDRPRAVGSKVLGIAEDHGDAGSDEKVGGKIEHELQEQQLETDTPPVSDMAALESALRSRRAKADAAAREAGARIVASGTSPFPVEPQIVHEKRYERMAERFGLTATEQLACGCHVHVSVESDDEAIGVLDRIRIWLPTLLALSANSPFWQGTDTKYASFRSQTMIRWPISGPTDVFGTAENYRGRVAHLLASGVLLDEAMIYSDARPSHRYPTVEIRVADVCLDARDAVLVAALCRGLVETAARQWNAGEPPPSTSTELLRLATWQASREGVSGHLLDPHASTPRPAREVVDELVEYVGSALRRTSDRALVDDRIEDLFARGNGASRQRAVMARTGRLTDVVADLVRATCGDDD
jgi:glutamate---cysteine ligase / carboxylate-amine ligase